MKKSISIVLAFLFVLLLFSYASAEEVKKDDMILFGHYEQDNDLGNGPEPIEWIVLDTQDGKALLLSKYGLDAVPYNTDSDSPVTWETCTLRAWLNTTFFESAFTQEEAEAILLTEVDNSSAQCSSEWDTAGGNNTQDRLFLLSAAEAKQYFGVTKTNKNNLAARLTSTAYAATKHASSYWWLRSPGWTRFNAAFVNHYGALESSMTFTIGNYAVRPTLWLDLGSLVYESVTVETTSDPAEVQTLSGVWKGTSKEKGTGTKYDLSIDINEDNSGVMRFSYNGQRLVFNCKFSETGTRLTIYIPAGSVGLKDISATYAVTDGVMRISMTFSYTSGGSQQYSCELQKGS